MKTFTVTLEDWVAEALERQAKDMGISVGEWLRFTVAQPLQFLTHTLAEPPSTLFEDYMAKIPKHIQAIMASAGQLTCVSCTQRLTVDEVKAGACGKCEAPIP